MTEQSSEPTVRVPGPAAAVVPPAVRLVVRLWWLALALGVASTLLFLAAGGLTLSAHAPTYGGAMVLIHLIGVAFALPPVAWWVVQGWATVRLRDGSATARTVLTVLGCGSVLGEILAQFGQASGVVFRLVGLVHVAVVVLVLVLSRAAETSEWVERVPAWTARGRLVLGSVLGGLVLLALHTVVSVQANL